MKPRWGLPPHKRLAVGGVMVHGRPGPGKVIAVDDKGRLGWATITARRDMRGVDVFVNLEFDDPDKETPPDRVVVRHRDGQHQTYRGSMRWEGGEWVVRVEDDLS